MKILLLLILSINPLTDLDKIAKVNAAKKEAELAYLAKDYSLAQEKYIYLKDSLGVTDDKILLNLANSQYLTNDSTGALSNYKLLKQSSDKKIASRANQQLGAMEFKSKKYEEALKHYKAALKSDPTNSEARYNYELLKKLIQEQEEQEQEEQQEQNKDQEQQEENKDQENQDQQNKEEQKENQEEQEKSEEQKQEEQEQKENQDEQKEQEEQKPEDQQEQEKEDQSKPNPIDEEKLKEMQISEEKAMLILEAMKNNEIQYIQQNKRKSKKKKDPSKPDW